MGDKKLFLNAPLSSYAEQELNRRIVKMIRSCGHEVYVPQEEIPPGSAQANPGTILDENIRAIEQADVIISILDKPGLGVALELGYVLALEKPMYLLRTDEQDYLGKIVEGLWLRTPPNQKATSIPELEALLCDGRSR